MKEVRRTKVEQIKRIIIALIFFILPPVTQIRNPAPNEKGSVGEHSTMSETWFGNISAGLQERCGEIPCRDHIQVIAYSVVSDASEEEQFAGGGGTRGKCMNTSRK
jgi:hypothetical protein